jgi:hypothetical protein
MNDSDLRVTLYRETVATGRVPRADVLAGKLRVPVGEVREGFERLAASRVLALQPTSREILFAAPFSAVPTPFVVHAAGRSYFSPCIWDTFGIIGILKTDAEIESSCSCCGEAMSIKILEGQLVPASGVIHFALPAKRWWENIVFT